MGDVLDFPKDGPKEHALIANARELLLRTAKAVEKRGRTDLFLAMTKVRAGMETQWGLVEWAIAVGSLCKHVPLPGKDEDTLSTIATIEAWAQDKSRKRGEIATALRKAERML